MKEKIQEIRSLLDRLEASAEEAESIAVTQAFSGMELPNIICDVVDLLLPSLTPYQAVIYINLLRKSVLVNGTQLLRVSSYGLREGIIKSASGKSESLSLATVRESLDALCEIGAIVKQGEPNREGTPYRILLPEEIEMCRAAKDRMREVNQPAPLLDSELDYYNVRENRLKVYERDAFKCQYCGKQLTRFTATLDHVIAVSQGGDNGFDNLATACRECNSKKTSKLLGDFMADSNPA